MKTVTVQIGNSDDKLNEKDYAVLIEKVGAEIIRVCPCPIQRSKHASSVAWVFPIENKEAEALRQKLAYWRVEYLQELIAWTEVETFLI